MRIRAAIIGSGLIAGKKHIPAFLSLKRKVELGAICDLNVNAARSVAAKFGVPRVYGDVNEMLAAERPQLVDICTPPQTHASLAVEVMKQGSHVLIEKPMAMTATDCDQIITASRHFGVKVCVAHSDLFYSPFIKARELVAKGAIGRFRGMRIFLSTPTEYMTAHPDHWAHRLPGGVIGETGPHVVYMTLAFINPIKHVSVTGTKLMEQYPWSRFEDYRIEMVGDAGASSVTLSYATNQWAARVDILGERGSFVLDLEGMYLLRRNRPKLTAVPVGLSVLSEVGQLMRNVARNTWKVATRQVYSTHELIISGFVDSIVSDTEPPVSAQEGREAVRVLNLIAAQLEATRQQATEQSDLAQHVATR